ncbi:MAG: endonuclease/exonuclease/phosphatase family protein [Microbacterium sp.]
MKVISYNLNKNQAAHELDALVDEHDPSVLCIQEADTSSLPGSIGDLVLARATERNRLGLAMYYRADTYRLEGVKVTALKKSMHDRLLRPAHERLLGARMVDIDAGREVIFASFHAAPLTALNSLRRTQIRAALASLHGLGPGLPTLMVGDYNYPVFKERLHERVRGHGYTMTLSDSRTYTRYRFLKGHYDFATSQGLSIDDITTLPQGRSDHMPILVTASYR